MLGRGLLWVARWLSTGVYALLWAAPAYWRRGVTLQSPLVAYALLVGVVVARGDELVGSGSLYHSPLGSLVRWRAARCSALPAP